MVTSKLKPIAKKSTSDVDWAVGGICEGDGEFLLHLHVDDACQDGLFWVCCIGWQWNGEELFGIFAVVGVQGPLAEQESPRGHGGIGAGVLMLLGLEDSECIFNESRW